MLVLNTTSTTILRKTPPLFYLRSFHKYPSSSSSSNNPLQFLTHTCISNKVKLGFSSKPMPMGNGFSPFSALSAGGGGTGGAGSGGNGASSGDNANFNSKWTFLAWYMDLLVKFPVLTKAVTSALLNLIGDLICQLVIDKVPSLDYKRTFMFTFLGFSLVGPTLHYWYLYLSKLVTIPGASGALLRLLLDQFLFAPIFIGTFLSALMTLEGRPSQIVPKLRQEWFSSVLANWKLWIPFQFLNFRFVPQQFQVLASNFVAVIWNVILSFKAHTEVVPK